MRDKGPHCQHGPAPKTAAADLEKAFKKLIGAQLIKGRQAISGHPKLGAAVCGLRRRRRRRRGEQGVFGERGREATQSPLLSAASSRSLQRLSLGGGACVGERFAPRLGSSAGVRCGLWGGGRRGVGRGVVQRRALGQR